MNKLTRRSFVAIAAAGVLALALAGCGSGNSGSSGGSTSTAAPASAAASASALRFTTGGESGTYYAFGNVIAQHATNNAGVEVTAVTSGGSQANIEAIEDGAAQLGFCQSDVMAYAYEGTNIFAESGAVDCFSTVACLYDEQVQIITTDPDIKTVADLAGKNVSIGAAGSGVYFNAIDILGVYGLTENDINPTYQSFKDSAADIQDGKIDAAFIVAGAPTTAVTELSTVKQAYLVSIEDDKIDALLATSPYYVKTVIPAGTYAGVDTDTTTVAIGAVILASNDVPDDVIYAFTADIFDNYESLTDSHAKYAELSLEKGASITAVPYHPGAAKYFAEKGLTVPTK